MSNPDSSRSPESSSGSGRFLLGLIMMCGGGYLFFNNIHVHSHFSFSQSLWRSGPVNLTQGMILIPFVLGIGMMFYNSRNWLGWLLTLGSLTAFSFGIIASIGFNLRSMTAFELLGILILMVGGLGLFLSSVNQTSRSSKASS